VLGDRLGLSWLGSRTAHARQQTLGATIGWSYDLLTPQLQSALKRLAVFSGGFTLEAAGAVTGTAENVAITVAALAEQSLIAADISTRPDRPQRPAVRYRMLETIRQYCAGRIADNEGPDGEQADRDAHSRFFAGLARRASGALTGWHQGEWLTTLEADHANLVVAINHFLSRPSGADEALQMIVHLDRFWHNRGHLAECATLLHRGLAASGQDVSPILRCAALNLAGQAAVHYDAKAARSYFTESIDVAKHSHEDFHAARALWGLASMSDSTADPEGRRVAGKAAMDLARALGDLVLLGECLVSYGTVVGDPQAQQAIYQEALAVTRRSGDRINTGWAHNNLANPLLAEKDSEAERYHLEQARAIFRELGAPQLVPVTNLGLGYLRQGNCRAADATFTEALHESEIIHDRRVASYVILGFAFSAAARREWERAACLFGFADTEFEDCGMSWGEEPELNRGRSLADVQRQLGDEFDRHYYSGRIGDRSDLIDFALRRRPIL